jgi:hypothetical protein
MSENAGILNNYMISEINGVLTTSISRRRIRERLIVIKVTRSFYTTWVSSLYLYVKCPIAHRPPVVGLSGEQG